MSDVRVSRQRVHRENFASVPGVSGKRATLHKRRTLEHQVAAAETALYVTAIPASAMLNSIFAVFSSEFLS